MSRRRSRGRAKQSTQGTRPGQQHGESAPRPPRREERGQPDLLAETHRALRRDHPFPLLGLVSSLLAVVDPRSQDPFQRARGERPNGPSLTELVGSFIDVRLRETTALLHVIGEMVDDELLAARIRRELELREHRLPAWLEGLAPLEVYRAVGMSHVLGDGDNVMLAARTASGHELAVVAYIDHNLGTLIKDAFVVPELLEVVIERLREAAEDDPDIRLQDLDLANARAWLVEAGETAAITFPAFESDAWPACRPLVEWVVRQLPEGGRGYVRPEWDHQARHDLAERFFSSSFGVGLDEEDQELFDSVLWFACDYGPGDPIRWSPTAVEILFNDWLPRKVVADVRFLARAPRLLRAFVRFCHAERGIRPSLTEETLAAIDWWEPDYQRAIRSSRLQGPAALVAVVGALDGDEVWPGWDDEPVSFEEAMLDLLCEAVGGEEALAALDDHPLPDEPFDWDGVPGDIADRVAEVLALCDRCCHELLDSEHRTACRRVLARVATGDPAVFRRKARAETAAAAICWIIGKANDLFSTSAGGMYVKELTEWFGITQGSVSPRAATLLRAAGFDGRSFAYQPSLGTPELLVSGRRRRIIERRDRFREMLEG